MLLTEVSDINKLINTIGIKPFYQKLIQKMREDFKAWNSFQKSPRHAFYVKNGVIELMPICGKDTYSVKYVNGHPNNTKSKKPNIVALGLLAKVETGMPFFISEMTLLTALRTAAVNALAASYLAKPKSKKLTIIGCGAQSEFQVLAHHAVFNLEEVRYFDLDPKAMKRFAKHLEDQSFKLIPGKSTRDAIKGVDIIITATAAKKKQIVLKNEWLEPGQHINGIGGDSPGKTELDINILKKNKVIIEYFPQTHHEGEIQNLGKNAKKYIYAELWEIASGKKKGRSNNKEITVFDDVGFALEDYSVLRLTYDLAKKYQLGKDVELIPGHMENCKDLFGFLLPQQQKTNNNSIAIIGWASGIAANNPDCGLGPIYMHSHAGLFKNFSKDIHWEALIQPKLSPNENTTKSVSELNLQLAEQTEKLSRAQQPFCVISGDHSSAIGTWSGVAHAHRKQGDIGLIWIDAHMDSHTPETSSTGNIHGMPIAHLLGHGIKSLKELLDKKAKLKPENICLIGIRSYEFGEAKLLEDLGVKVFFMEDIEKYGVDAIVQEALEHVNKNTCAFGISIDLDAFDPSEAPGVGCREQGGLKAQDLIKTLKSNKAKFPFVGLEISEYNPLRDEQQKTAKLIIDLMDAVYGKSSNFLK